jgi:hypothetical protein
MAADNDVSSSRPKRSHRRDPPVKDSDRRDRPLFEVYATCEEVAELDAYLFDETQSKVEWKVPLHLGGSRRSQRLRQTITAESVVKTMMVEKRLGELFQVVASPADFESGIKPASVDDALGSKKKRRLIQFAYELLGTPPEHYPNGVSRWEGKSGVINVIRDYLCLQSHRARKQIRAVLQYVHTNMEAGAKLIDAGVRSNARLRLAGP